MCFPLIITEKESLLVSAWFSCLQAEAVLKHAYSTCVKLPLLTIPYSFEPLRFLLLLQNPNPILNIPFYFAKHCDLCVT